MFACTNSCFSITLFPCMCVCESACVRTYVHMCMAYTVNFNKSRMTSWRVQQHRCKILSPFTTHTTLPKTQTKRTKPMKMVKMERETRRKCKQPTLQHYRQKQKKQNSIRTKCGSPTSKSYTFELHRCKVVSMLKRKRERERQQQKKSNNCYKTRIQQYSYRNDCTRTTHTRFHMMLITVCRWMHTHNIVCIWYTTFTPLWPFRVVWLCCPDDIGLFNEYRLLTHWSNTERKYTDECVHVCVFYAGICQWCC